MLKGPLRVLGVVPRSDRSCRLAAMITDGTSVSDVYDGMDFDVPSGGSGLVDAIAAAVLAYVGGAERFDLLAIDGIGVDGDALSLATRTTVAWNLNEADLRFGGLGGPWLGFFDHALCRQSELAGVAACVDLGAVTHLAMIDVGAETPDDGGVMIEMDTGPGVGSGPSAGDTGAINEEVVASLMDDPFYLGLAPRRAPQEGFVAFEAELAALEDPDAVATRRAAIAMSLADGLESAPALPDYIILGGEGAADTSLVEMIGAVTGIDVVTMDDLGVNSADHAALSVAFAGARMSTGLPTSSPAATGVAAAVAGGTISRP